jgi:hypothetical protein
VKELSRLGLVRQLVLAALISCTAAAVRRSDATPLGALSLQPLSVTASNETLSVRLDMLSSPVPLLVENNEQQLPPVYASPVSEFIGRSSSPDFATILQSMDSPEYAGGEPMAPVPETSTWVAAMLGLLVLLRSLQKRVGPRVCRAIRR